MPSDGAPAGGRGTLARLGRALLDATLLLVAAVLVLLLLLAVQVRGIVSDARALMDSRAATTELRLAEARAALDQALTRIDTRDQTGPIAPIAPGAISPADPAGGVGLSHTGLAVGALRDAQSALGGPADPADPAPGTPLADGLLRQIALTILAMAAQEIRAIPPRPGPDPAQP